MKQRLCQWGNCREEKTRVTLNYYDIERPAFCCEEHAAMWLLSRIGHRYEPNAVAMNCLRQLEQEYALDPNGKPLKDVA